MTRQDTIQEIKREFLLFEKQAGELPKKPLPGRYKGISAVWVVSGAGSISKRLLDTPSDKFYKKYKWYGGQDKARLNYAAKWFKRLSKISTEMPWIIYNGTQEQNEDLKKAVKENKISFSGAKLFIPDGEIIRTLDQIKKFSLPKSLKASCRLAVLSHSAHLPRILRFMAKHSKAFKGLQIVPLSINVKDSCGQEEMKQLEMENLLGYIQRGEAAEAPYPYLAEVAISPVTEKDVVEIFWLSNEPSVRAASFNQSKIKLVDHKKWFKGKLENPDVLMLKATIGGSLAGQVRLDIEGTEAVIGISVSEKFRGRGVAGILVKAMLKEAQSKRVRQIDAFIRPENSASIHLFEKMGFKFSAFVDQRGVPARKYIYKIGKK